MCKATLPDGQNTFYVCFDLLEESAVKYTSPPEDQTLLGSKANKCKKNPFEGGFEKTLLGQTKSLAM